MGKIEELKAKIQEEGIKVPPLIAEAIKKHKAYCTALNEYIAKLLHPWDGRAIFLSRLIDLVIHWRETEPNKSEWDKLGIISAQEMRDQLTGRETIYTEYLQKLTVIVLELVKLYEDIEFKNALNALDWKTQVKYRSILTHRLNESAIGRIYIKEQAEEEAKLTTPPRSNILLPLISFRFLFYGVNFEAAPENLLDGTHSDETIINASSLFLNLISEIAKLSFTNYEQFTEMNCRMLKKFAPNVDLTDTVPDAIDEVKTILLGTGVSVGSLAWETLCTQLNCIAVFNQLKDFNSEKMDIKQYIGLGTKTTSAVGETYGVLRKIIPKMRLEKKFGENAKGIRTLQCVGRVASSIDIIMNVIDIFQTMDALTQSLVEGQFIEAIGSGSKIVGLTIIVSGAILGGLQAAGMIALPAFIGAAVGSAGIMFVVGLFAVGLIVVGESLQEKRRYGLNNFFKFCFFGKLYDGSVHKSDGPSTGTYKYKNEDGDPNFNRQISSLLSLIWPINVIFGLYNEEENTLSIKIKLTMAYLDTAITVKAIMQKPDASYLMGDPEPIFPPEVILFESGSLNPNRNVALKYRYLLNNIRAKLKGDEGDEEPITVEFVPSQLWPQDGDDTKIPRHNRYTQMGIFKKDLDKQVIGWSIIIDLNRHGYDYGKSILTVQLNQIAAIEVVHTLPNNCRNSIFNSVPLEKYIDNSSLVIRKIFKVPIGKDTTPDYSDYYNPFPDE